jgi:L-malate glycosyltransferase
VKVLIIIPEFATGGAERVVSSLVRGFNSPENQVTLLVFNTPERSEALEAIHSSTPIITLSKEKSSTLLFIGRLIRVILNRSKYDIILANLQPSAYYLALLQPIIRRPVIYILHNEYKPLKNRLKRLTLERFLRSKKVSLVSVSEQIKEHFSKIYGLIPEVISNGIRFTATTNQREAVAEQINKLKKNADTLVFIGVQRLVWFKNLTSLTAVFKDLFIQGENIILVLIGDDPSGDKNEKKKIEEINAPNVFLFGQKENIADYLVNAHCFCIVSSSFEGTPIALLEALSHGLPVIGTMTGGIPMVIRDPDNGILCHPSYESILHAVKRFIELPGNELMRINEANKRLFFAEYEEAKMLERYKQLASHLVNDGR